MTYSEFTLDTVLKTFDLKIQREQLFERGHGVDVPQWLQEALKKGSPFALGSEKARSEFIVSPVLLTVVEHGNNAFAIYSGQRLDVDSARGLVGECDFVVCHTPPLPIMQVPIVTIVEAKKHDIEAGLGQCAAQMVGAMLFNQQEGRTVSRVFGCVTNGEAWQFLKLEENGISVDSQRYYIDTVGALLHGWYAILEHYSSQRQ